MESQTQNGEQEFATGNYYSKPAALGKIMNSNNDESKYEYIRVRNVFFLTIRIYRSLTDSIGIFLTWAWLSGIYKERKRQLQMKTNCQQIQSKNKDRSGTAK